MVGWLKMVSAAALNLDWYCDQQPVGCVRMAGGYGWVGCDGQVAICSSFIVVDHQWNPAEHGDVGGENGGK